MHANGKLMAAAVLTLAAVVRADFKIEIDATAKPVKDVRTSTCGPEVGYAGTMADNMFGGGLAASDDYWFVSNRVETARAMREAGAWHQRVWHANDWFVRRKPNPNPQDRKYRRTNPEAAFRFWRENGFKILLTLEAWDDAGEQTALEFVKWIADNGYKDVVSGFELGNESYFSPRYPSLAPRWTRIVNEMVKIWPGVKIGITIAENFELNPDLTQVRSRMLSAGTIKRDTYFAAADFNRYSAQFIVGMSNCLDKVTHITFHAYGAETPYSCSYYGIQRLRGWCAAFPEIKDKKWWFTEIRPRSDEDNRCQRLFREALIMAHYSLTAIMQPELDGFNHHQIWAISGGLYQSTGSSWSFQWQDAGGEFADFRSPYGQPRLEVGAMGVMYRTLAEGILQHPLIIAHGTSKGQGLEDGFYTSARLTDQVYLRRRALKEGKGDAAPKVEGEVEWVATLNPQRNDLCLLMVNSKSVAEKVSVTVLDRIFAAPVYRALSCPEEYLDCRAVPGEGRFWTQTGWEDTQFGFDNVRMEKYEGMKSDCSVLPVTIRPNTVQSVTVRLAPLPRRSVAQQREKGYTTAQR